MRVPKRARKRAVDDCVGVARAAVQGAHLSGYGGTGDGVTGAAAGVGLTAEGWSGRFIELDAGGRPLRDLPDPVAVGALAAAGIPVVSLDRDAPVPLPADPVVTNGWLRPRLWGGRAVLPVQRSTLQTGGWPSRLRSAPILRLTYRQTGRRGSPRLIARRDPAKGAPLQALRPGDGRQKEGRGESYDSPRPDLRPSRRRATA
jgi:hypothetical protein